MSGRNVLTRDQDRALHAYKSVRAVPEDKILRRDYKIAVNDLGATVLRSGLAAAMSLLERQKKNDKAAARLLEHLVGAKLPGLHDATAADLPDRIRGLALDEYILATRELLRVVIWFRRAVQATFGSDS